MASCNNPAGWPKNRNWHSLRPFVRCVHWICPSCNVGDGHFVRSEDIPRPLQGKAVNSRRDALVAERIHVELRHPWIQQDQSRENRLVLTFYCFSQPLENGSPVRCRTPIIELDLRTFFYNTLKTTVLGRAVVFLTSPSRLFCEHVRLGCTLHSPPAIPSHGWGCVWCRRLDLIDVNLSSNSPRNYGVRWASRNSNILLLDKISCKKCTHMTYAFA